MDFLEFIMEKQRIGLAFKKSWMAWSKTKRILTLTSFILSFLILGGFIGWVLSLPRSWQLMKWSPMYLYILIIFCILLVLIPVGSVFDVRYRIKKNLHPSKIPGKYMYVLFLAGILIPTGYLLYLTPYLHEGDKAPELLIIDQAGSEGIPNLAVVFYTQSKSINFLDYGIDASDLSIHVAETEKTHTHGLILADLVPDTQYFYQINGKETIYNFTSFPLMNYRFVLTSDTHIGAELSNTTATQKILSQISDPTSNYDAFFCLGDLIEMGNQDDLYRDQIDMFSPVTTHIPYRPVIGNHDGWFGGVSLWEDNFYPECLPSESSDSPLWHRFDFGNRTHVFMLDLEWGTESYTEAQRTWFEAELQKLDPTDWIIVMNHAYYYASSTEYSSIPWYDNQEMIQTFNPIFQQYGVDLVFSGHDHQMEHIAQQGVDYFIVGAGGGHLDDNATVSSENTQFYDNTHHGYLDVQFLPGNATVSFRTPENVVLYTVTIEQ